MSPVFLNDRARRCAPTSSAFPGMSDTHSLSALPTGRMAHFQLTIQSALKELCGPAKPRGPWPHQNPDVQGKLCVVCRKLGIPCKVDHYPTYALLCQSAFEGCELCIALKYALLQEYCRYYGWPQHAAELHHQELDSKPNTGFSFSSSGATGHHGPFEGGSKGISIHREEPIGYHPLVGRLALEAPFSKIQTAFVL